MGRLEENPSWASSILKTSKLLFRSRVIAEATVASDRTVFEGEISSEVINSVRLAILADGIKVDYYSVLSQGIGTGLTFRNLKLGSFCGLRNKP